MNKYWVAPSTGLYDSTANWSLTSGGPGGIPYPDQTDVAIFDASGQGSCEFDIPIHVLGLTVTTDYSGVLLQESYPIQIDTSGWNHGGGIFSGRDSSIVILGDLSISSTYICTSNVTTVFGDFYYNPMTSTEAVDKNWIVEEYTLNATDALSQTMTLSRIPIHPTEVALNLIDGVAQIYGYDYDVYGMTVRWNGLQLQNENIGIGDTLRVMYQPDTTRGEFFHNYGTFLPMVENKIFDPNGAFFYNLAFVTDQTPAGNRVIQSHSSVLGNLYMQSGYLNKGSSDATILTYGDVYSEPNFGKFSPLHNATVAFICGEEEQSIYQTGGIFPNLLVDKTTAEPVLLLGTTPLYVSGDFVITDGTFNSKGIDIRVGTY